MVIASKLWSQLQGSRCESPCVYFCSKPKLGQMSHSKMPLVTPKWWAPSKCQLIVHITRCRMINPSQGVRWLKVCVKQPTRAVIVKSRQTESIDLKFTIYPSFTFTFRMDWCLTTAPANRNVNDQWQHCHNLITWCHLHNFKKACHALEASSALLITHHIIL